MTTNEPNTFHYPRFQSIEHLKTAVTNGGNHFFDRDAMRFFGSRIGRTLYGGRFFVTSERQSYEHERRYTVRFVRKTIDFDGDWHMEVTASRGFQAFGSHSAATRYAKMLAESVASTKGVTPLTVDDDAEYLDVKRYREV